MMARSAGVSLMATKAAAVVLSNTVAAPLTASMRSRMAFRGASSINWPASRIRSLKRTRWGEV